MDAALRAEGKDDAASSGDSTRATTESSLSALARWWYRSASQKNANRDLDQLMQGDVGDAVAERSLATVSPPGVALQGPRPLQPTRLSPERSRQHPKENRTDDHEIAIEQSQHAYAGEAGTASTRAPSERRGSIALDASAVLLSADMLHKLVKPDMAGYLYYRWRMRWQRCWFSLDGSQLRFFERDPRTGRRGRLIHTVSLFYWDYIRTPSYTDPRRPYILELKDVKGVVHYFAADTEEELIRWKEAFFRARSIAPPAHAIPSLAEGDPTNPKASTLDQEKAASAAHRRSIRGALAEVTPPRHLICIVHGIGSDEERLRENLRNFHEALEEVMQNILPDALTQFGIKTIYCHWRSALRRLAVYQRMLQLNPLGDQTPSRWRTLINNKLMDILFYLTPRIKRFIQCEVVAQLNEEYERFRLKYPEFRGDISILGHSLGSVISYELLVQQVLGDPVMLEREGLRLRFPVHNLFLTGSPLGHVLNVDDELRSTIGCWPFRLVNIINPSDPAACRIEPVLDPFFADIPPVEIPTMAGGKSSWLSFQSTGRQSPSLTNPAEHRGTRASTAPNVDQVESGTHFETAPQNDRHPGSTTSEWVAEPGPMRAAKASQRTFNSPGSIEFQEWFPQLDAARRLVRRVRIDYVMRPNFMEDLWGLSAHLNYWRSRDVAHFIIHYIVRQQLEREQRHHAHRGQLERDASALKENHKSSTSGIQTSERATFVATSNSSSIAGTRLEASSEPLSPHSRRLDTPIIEHARDERGSVPVATDEARSRHVEQTTQIDDKSYSDFAKDRGVEHQDAEEANLRIDRATPANHASTTIRSPSFPEHTGPDGTQCHRMQSADISDVEEAQQVPLQSPNRLSAAYPTVRSAFMTRLGGLRSAPDPETEAAGTPSETISSDIERAGDLLDSNRISPARPASV